jgi:hypothetical protein
LFGLNRPLQNPGNCLDLPLHLFEVLEQEYLTIHGEISEQKVIRLHDRDVTAVLDWSFHESHIRDAAALRNRLRAPRVGTGQKSLADYFKERLGSAGAPEQRLAEILNSLLEVKLYDANQFRHDSLPTIQPILDLGLYSDRISGDELKQFNRLLLEDLFSEELEKVRDIRLAAIFARLHEKRQCALALSGGGTRSGTFALGLLQGLANHKLLGKFNYLSTVSGGGYIGAWLSAWILRHRDGFNGVRQDLVNSTPSSRIDPDPAPVGYLRAYSNFLTPKVGLFSTDTWTFLAIYGRNLLLNWCVLIPILLGFLLIPRLAVSSVLAEPQFKVEVLGRELFLRHLFLVLGAALAVWAAIYAGVNRPGFRARLKDRWPFLARRSDQDGFVLYCLLPLVSSGLLLTTYWAWTTRENKSLWAFALFGTLLPIVSGLISSGGILGRRDWKELCKELLAAAVSGGLAGLAISAAANFLQPLGNQWSTEIYVCAALPLFLLIFHLGSTIYVGFASHTNLINDEDREWWARFNGVSLIVAVAWGVFTSLVLFGPLILLAAPKTLASIGSASGLVATLLGRSEKTPSNNQEKKSRFGLAMDYVLPAFAAVFLGVLIASLSLLTSLGIQQLVHKLSEMPGERTKWAVNLAPLELETSLKALDPNTLKPVELNPMNEYSLLVKQPFSAITHFRLVHYPSVFLISLLMVTLGAVGFGLSRAINLNYFSLHGGYRNRLIRGFLGASRGEGLRRPNPFTGFDPADNIHMHELRPALLHESDLSNFERLAHRLATSESGTSDPQARLLNGELSGRVKEELREYVEAGAILPLSQRLKVDLIEDLNRILEGDTCLYKEPAFEDVWKDASTREIPTRDYHIHRNRWVLERAFPKHIRKSDYPPHRLFHVVNATLNLVGGNNLAWQQRKAESFTVTALHSGAHRVGYRKSMDYGGDDGISMGTAFAVSGAAASSNMGYYTSSPLISILLTFFNVRLGWWLGNPGLQGSRLYTPYGRYGRKLQAEGLNRIYRRASPVFSIMPIFYEALGLTDDQHKYVYLSDGGHFENLALYEMVLRRCNLIVLSDGAADPDYEFSDLGNAVRKIRIDLGIRIEFDQMPIFKEKPKDGGGYWSIARIRYSDVDGDDTADGVLIYIKPAVYFDEPQDICNYKRQFPDFPHETTADQFFDEPQFESHRALGSYIMEKICESLPEEAVVNESIWRAEFVQNLVKQLKGMASQVKDPDWLGDWLKDARDRHRTAAK